MLLAGPSGVGKDAVRDALRAQHGNEIYIPLTVTTRAPRDGEQDGREYRFVDNRQFDHMERHGAFVENAVVHGNCYGTPWDEMEAGHARGQVTILKVDVQGAEHLRRVSPEALGIFLMPGSIRELRDRLEARGMKPGDIETRMENAGREIARSALWTFQRRVINREGRLDETVGQVWRIIQDDRRRLQN